MARRKVHGVILIGWAMFFIAAGVFIAQHFRNSNSPVISAQPLSASEDDDYLKTTGMTPKQAAKTFFEACEKENWDELAKFIPPEMKQKEPGLVDRFKKGLGGIQIISLGAPFKGMVKDSGTPTQYPGVWVPYDIKFKNGQRKQYQLALRCDNPEHHWYWDGGL